MDLISKEKPDVLIIQETMVSNQTNFNLNYYNGLFKEGHTNCRAQRGLAIFINVTIPYQKLTLNLPLQAIAARINIGKEVTIVSNYNSRNHELIEDLFSTLSQQLPKPVILTWDHFSYLQIWGNPVNNNRGCQVLSFIIKHKLNILNDGRHTRTSSISKSVIDFTIPSLSLQPIRSSDVANSHLSSDHCVINVNVKSKNT